MVLQLLVRHWPDALQQRAKIVPHLARQVLPGGYEREDGALRSGRYHSLGWGLGSQLGRVAESGRQWETAGVCVADGCI